MENTDPQILDAFVTHPKLRRRALLPWWIRFFSWIFMILGALTIPGVIAGIFGISFQLSLYGMETFSPLSAVGLFLTALIFFKGLTAFALWTERDWAISIAQIDAILGIIICTYVMVIQPIMSDTDGFKFTFRLELLLLIPYLIKIGSIKSRWEESEGNHQ